ncbi:MULTISPECIES: hypothetical protein [unclassified Sphingomonas]|uniref:hypothetical protein n=1 Tax=unclassified Sphingomonas TaxID=196159 RepID=UPI0021510F3B|nr:MULTISPECIES: hypothetical protein [unclassified Sphingomonas]MCR5870700.1 hypothetical protein [Sphingomonas sp. J344]UUY00964.1 hypothetical protein LRS08_07885 [Sphingomonas sp. J315]
MNAQQGRIQFLLEQAVEQYLDDGVVDVAIQSELSAEGYLLRNLTRDVERILADR